MTLTHEILTKLFEKYCIERCSEYGEPGYSTNKKGILFADWNNVKQSTGDRLEKEYQLEWSDEWIIDRDKAYRTRPNCYSWKPSILILDDYTISIDDVEEDPSEYLEYLTNNPNAANCFDIDLSIYGFSLVEGGFEAGFYGTDDSPAEILKKLLDKYPNGKFIFSDFKPEQFRVCFSVWGKNLEISTP